MVTGWRICRSVLLLSIALIVFVCSSIAQLQQAGGSLSVAILDAEGQPSNAPTIRAYELQANDGVRRAVARPCVSYITSNRARCEHLLSGDYLLEVVPRASALSTTAVPELPTYYPGTTDPAEAESVHLSNGSDQSLSLEMLAMEVKPMRLVLPPTANLPAVSIQRLAGSLRFPVLTINPQPGAKVSTPALPGGTYQVDVVWNQDGVTHHAQGSIQHDGTKEEVLKLTEWYAQNVVGTIEIAEGEQPRKIQMVSIDDPTKTFASAMLPEGKFQIADVLPGRYWVTLPGSALTVADVNLGSSHHTGNVLDVPETGPLAPLELRAVRANGRILGRLIPEGIATSRAGVSLLSIESGETRTAPVDAAGNFVFENLPEGSYRLDGWLRLDSAPYRDPDALMRVENDSTTTTVSSGAMLPTINVVMHHNE